MRGSEPGGRRGAERPSHKGDARSAGGRNGE